MDLIVAATAQEIQPLIDSGAHGAHYKTLITGPGAVETTLQLTRFLTASTCPEISRVLNVGVAGAYCDNGVEILDICLATQEIYADFGIVYDTKIETFTFPGTPNLVFDTDVGLLDSCQKSLKKRAFQVKRGTFLTVNSASGTLKRGNYLMNRYQAICENMEGFAVARVCHFFSLSFIELRCISNLVEDRNICNWRLKDACEKLGEAVAAVVA